MFLFILNKYQVSLLTKVNNYFRIAKIFNKEIFKCTEDTFRAHLDLLSDLANFATFFCTKTFGQSGNSILVNIIPDFMSSFKRM